MGRGQKLKALSGSGSAELLGPRLRGTKAAGLQNGALSSPKPFTKPQNEKFRLACDLPENRERRRERRSCCQLLSLLSSFGGNAGTESGTENRRVFAVSKKQSEAEACFLAKPCSVWLATCQDCREITLLR